MRVTAIERHAPRTLAFVPPLALAGLTALLFTRLLPDVAGKPLHEDEAVAGLISARPLGDLLHTVVLDRGGAPLHFVLAHFALAIDMTPEALRWVSVAFALATVPLCYDLAPRLKRQDRVVDLVQEVARACPLPRSPGTRSWPTTHGWQPG